MPTHLDGHEFHLPPPTRAGQRAVDADASPVDTRHGLEIIGNDVFRLTRGGRPVGWVRGASIRVGAFPAESEAMRAALRGGQILDDHLSGGSTRRARDGRRADAGEVREIRRVHAAVASPGDREREGWPPPTRTLTLDTPDSGDAVGDAAGDVRLVHDGAYEWIVHGQRPIARLIRPGPRGAVSEPSASTFALEFVVPSTVPSVLRVTLARALVHALDAAPPDHAEDVTEDLSCTRSTLDDPPPRPTA